MRQCKAVHYAGKDSPNARFPTTAQENKSEAGNSNHHGWNFLPTGSNPAKQYRLDCDQMDDIWTQALVEVGHSFEFMPGCKQAPTAA
ncbi:hypothetical protein SDC9_187033 [bioreactor metagenome]|uniref:Uncharacterized protein n=1 Tax=bioreactor metagenome TaxID=1076179 RepID=A0A645HKG2_9ZZZZ